MELVREWFTCGCRNHATRLILIPSLSQWEAKVWGVRERVSLLSLMVACRSWRSSQQRENSWPLVQPTAREWVWPERKRDRDRNRDRQRKTERERDRQTDRQRQWETEKERCHSANLFILPHLRASDPKKGKQASYPWKPVDEQPLAKPLHHLCSNRNTAQDRQTETQTQEIELWNDWTKAWSKS